jgi:hypothetical protein
MEVHMLLHERGHEKVRVVVALLHAHGDWEAGRLCCCLKRLWLQLWAGTQTQADSLSKTARYSDAV